MTDPVEPEAAPPPVDTSSLTWLLVIVGLANLIGISHGMMSREEILNARPELTPALLNGAMGAAVANVVSIVGLLRWRRWGAVGLTLGLLVLLMINLRAGAPFAVTLLPAVAMLLVGIYLWPLRWRLG